jgi:pimeloyl-ACP methyl ester carboxylesterase
MAQPDQAERSLEWIDTLDEALSERERRVVLRTNDGDIECRYHPAEGAGSGVVWVGGAGGGLDGPARGLYPEMCGRLQGAGIAGLRLHYRYPNHLEDCVLDTLLGAEFLADQGVERVAVVGHSFGGAVVVMAAAVSPRVAACVPMSTQTYGTEMASQVSPKPMLLIHGSADEILPDACSRQVYAKAKEPKELVLLPGARHGLDEARQQVIDLLFDWLGRNLA